MYALLIDKIFTHLRAKHSKNYINLDNGTHIQSIEVLWSIIKRKSGKHGTNKRNTEPFFEKIKEELKKFKIFYSNS